MNLYQRVVRAKCHIDENFSSPLDSMAIAGEAYFSAYHFLRLFKKMYGLTPHRYLIRRRIDRAKELLVEKENLSITEICFEIGFESPGSFSTLFKKYAGCSPRAFREKEIKKKSEIAEHPIRFVPVCFIEKYSLEEKNS